jgi:hypothetical protein
MTLIEKCFSTLALAFVLVVGSNISIKIPLENSTSILPNIEIGNATVAGEKWFNPFEYLDTIIAHELTEAYIRDRDVIDAQRRAAGYPTDRSKAQRKIAACSIAFKYLGEQCIYDWDESTRQFIKTGVVGKSFNGGGGGW